MSDDSIIPDVRCLRKDGVVVMVLRACSLKRGEFHRFTVKPRLHDTTCCQTGCITGFDNRLYRVNGVLGLGAWFSRVSVSALEALAMMRYINL